MPFAGQSIQNRVLVPQPVAKPGSEAVHTDGTSSLKPCCLAVLPQWTFGIILLRRRIVEGRTERADIRRTRCNFQVDVVDPLHKLVGGGI